MGCGLWVEVTKKRIACQEKIDPKIGEFPPYASSANPAIKLGKEGVLGAEKRINDDYQFKSCIVGEKAGLLTSGSHPRPEIWEGQSWF